PAAPAREPRGVGDVLKPAPAQIAVQDVAAEAGDEEIGLAVAVVVPEDAPLRPVALRRDAGRQGDVLEGAVAAVAVEGRARLLSLRERAGPPAVRDEDVEEPVPVDVLEADAVADRLVDGVLARFAADALEP